MCTDREQKLVDITFSIAMTMHMYPKSFKKLDNEGIAAWVAKQLDGCGFPTTPVGSSWGVLKSRLNQT